MGESGFKYSLRNLLELRAVAMSVSTPSITALAVDGPLDPDALRNHLQLHGNGAVVSFVGHVRGIDDGEEVLALEFDAWREKLEPVLQRLAEESLDRHGVKSVVLAHRVGRVEPEEPIVAIHVASAHRAEAFQSCSWLIDELKKQAPLWKKEVKPEGVAWKSGLG